MSDDYILFVSCRCPLQAQRTYPWRSFIACHGLFPLHVWDVPPIEYCMQVQHLICFCLLMVWPKGGNVTQSIWSRTRFLCRPHRHEIWGLRWWYLMTLFPLALSSNWSLLHNKYEILAGRLLWSKHTIMFSGWGTLTIHEMYTPQVKLSTLYTRHLII